MKRRTLFAHRLRIARFGDNMREVAVTEGDKVEAQARLGYSVNGYGVGDLLCAINQISDSETEDLVADKFSARRACRCVEISMGTRI